MRTERASSSQAVRLLLVTNGPVGGAEVQMLRLVPHLLAAGYEVKTLSILPAPQLSDHLEPLGIDVVEVPSTRRHVLGTVLFARDVLRDFGAQIVVSFVYQANVVARVAGRLAGTPVVISSIRNERFGGRARDLVMRLTDPLATVTTTNSTLAFDGLLARRVVPPGRLEVIPNAIDPDLRRSSDARQRLRADLGVAEDTFLWLAAGRLEPQKDFGALLRAAAAGLGGARIVIAGDGSRRANLLGLKERLGLGDEVRFLGQRDDLDGLMSAADGFVLTSRWEGLPNVVMEAMASELPVVATAVGGVRELVTEGLTGLVVPPADVPALVSAMRRTMRATAAERAEIGRTARASVLARCDPDRVATQWLELLARVGRHSSTPVPGVPDGTYERQVLDHPA